MPATNEYILWPGPDVKPGTDLYPGWNKTANGAQIVHSHKGWEWEKVPDSDLSVAAMRAKAAVLKNMSLDISQLTASPDGTSDQVATRIWTSIIRSRAAEIDKISANMIDTESLRVGDAQIVNLDAGKITFGHMSGDRIAARSITAAQLATGTIKADSGVIESLDAGVIKFGELDGALIKANSIKASQIAADVFEGQVFTGSVFRTAASGPRIEINPTDGIQIFDAGGLSTQITSARGDEGFRVRAESSGQMVPLRDAMFSWIELRSPKHWEDGDFGSDPNQFIYSRDKGFPGHVVGQQAGVRIGNRGLVFWGYVRYDAYNGTGETMRTDTYVDLVNAQGVTVDEKKFQDVATVQYGNTSNVAVFGSLSVSTPGIYTLRLRCQLEASTGFQTSCILNGFDVIALPR